MEIKSESKVLDRPMSVIKVALLYALLGALGLSLAIPPGYASPIFPSAGFALAVLLQYGIRRWPGVWLGSFFLNVGLAYFHGNLSLQSASISAGIASCASLQAWFGCYLVNRWAPKDWREMEHEKALTSFLLLSGPLSCLVAATGGVSILGMAGIIGNSEYGFSWWSWYVGDTLGVLLMVPLTLVVFRRRDMAWRARLKFIMVPILGAMSFAMVAFFAAARVEVEMQQSALKDHGEQLSYLIDNRIIAHEEVLASLSRLIEVSPDLDFRKFDHFTSATLKKEVDIFALSFNPYVTNSERASFEQSMSGAYPDRQFQITERDTNQKLIRALDRPDYAPVGWISPLGANLAAIGYDIQSEPIRRDAIQRSLKTGAAAATAPIRLVQEAKERVGILMLVPAYDQDASINISKVRNTIKGFSVAVIKVDEMVEIALHEHLIPGLRIELLDPSAEESRQILYRSPETAKFGPGAPAWQTTLKMADRQWLLRVTPSQEYLAKNRSFMAWFAGVVGLLFATVLQVMILAITGRSSAIQRQVNAQTIEIRVKNEALNRAILETEAANLAKSRFLATMSHEIRTPMNGILGMAQMLLQPHLQDDVRNDYARTILSSGQTLLALLNDILDLSKIEAGKFQLETVVFSPQALMHETCNLFAGAAQAKGLQIESQWIGPPEQRYLGDSHRLRQMLANLVANAIKFTAHGSVRIKAVQTLREGQAALLEFSVHDTGMGIAPDRLDLLFKPFSQADNSTTREFGGSGLGLSIVRHLALAMNGDAGVESELGKGSTFWFRIRSQIVTEGQDSRGIERPAPDLVRPARLQGHVLVAEDNPVNAIVIGSLLGTLGVTMTLVEDGQQAVDAITQGAPSGSGHQPDLILMDLQMPVMDGYKATQQIRQWERDHQRPPLPIIALTADAFEEDRQHCLAVGMNDFLTKPIALDALNAALVTWLASEP